MDEFDDIRRLNPQAAEGVASMKGTLRDLAKLRQAGVARGPSPLLQPHGGGRYSLLREPHSPKPTIKASRGGWWRSPSPNYPAGGQPLG